MSHIKEVRAIALGFFFNIPKFKLYPMPISGSTKAN